MLLLGLTLLMAVTILLTILIPIAECPLCLGRRCWMVSGHGTCILCEGKGKVILIKLWRADKQGPATP